MWKRILTGFRDRILTDMVRLSQGVGKILFFFPLQGRHENRAICAIHGWLKVFRDVEYLFLYNTYGLGYLVYYDRL